MYKCVYIYNVCIYLKRFFIQNHTEDCTIVNFYVCQTN